MLSWTGCLMLIAAARELHRTGNGRSPSLRTVAAGLAEMRLRHPERSPLLGISHSVDAALALA